MAGNLTEIEQRKAEHIRINLDEDVQSKGITTGFEKYRFVHQALPELDFAQVRTSSEVLGHALNAPLLLSSMTGGVTQAREINRNLATAAERFGLSMGIGSQRLALEQPDLQDFFRIRDVAPNILLFANLGAVQLNNGYGVEECLRAVEMVGADALFLHLNPLQEAIQPGGNANFAGLTARIAEVCRALSVPVVVKEVGWGISGEAATMLATAGVAAIDVAGAGGTSWSEVERHRLSSPMKRQVAAAFAGWGIGTAESLVDVRRAVPDLPVFASGGIHTGMDVAKALALGAALVGLASTVLRAAVESATAVENELQVIIEELRTCMFCIGAGSLPALRDTPRLIGP
ncbi:MAG: isopentenyl-diphosphate delta-isomerase, type 2 [Chloroflexi bacterium]|nr:isopentenyl-diphosphate delta-isomerase, type 2 [Chloroflexota bacterium]